MRKEFYRDFISLRKTVMIALLTILLLLFSSCAAILDTIVGDSSCAHPGCNNNKSAHTAYCHYHIPPTLKDVKHTEIESKNAYKVHKPLSGDVMKVKIKKKY